MLYTLIGILWILFFIGMIEPRLYSRVLKGEYTRKRVALITIPTIFIIATISSIFNPPNPTPTNQQVTQNSPAQLSQTTNTPLQPTPTLTPDTPGFSDGSHVVGVDIKPGTYRLRTSPGGNCYYSRLSGFSGEFNDILANDNTSYVAVVTIKEADKGFVSRGCGRWSEDLSQVTSSKNTFENGIFIIGTDIEPGTYKSTTASGCYYSRLSGFSGDMSEIIANNNTDNAAVVTIAKTDKGFKSSRCGAWMKQ
jgi:hypothetical protein